MNADTVTMVVVSDSRRSKRPSYSVRILGLERLLQFLLALKIWLLRTFGGDDTLCKSSPE